MKHPQSTHTTHFLGLPIKYISLMVLTVQNTSAVLLMRYTKLTKGPPYRHTTAIVLGEIVKVLVCLLVVFREEQGSLSRLGHVLYRDVYSNPEGMLAMAVPAILYTIQNNLVFIAVHNLEAATFQVSYQLKILTTALFSTWMLRKRIGYLQWLALTLLAIGVGMAQIPPHSIHSRSIPPVKPLQDVAVGSATVAAVAHQGPRLQSTGTGLVAVLLASLSSGFSGVYFEKALKGGHLSIWIRNIQLGLFGLLFGLLTIGFNDWRAVIRDGFFYGYTPAVWIMVLVGALGGLTVAVVVKYADNILKGFATSMSIILSALVSMWLFQFQGHFVFWIGTLLVILAVLAYGQTELISKQWSNQASQTSPKLGLSQTAP
jgi:solute carrier family 35 (UDP-sugar transporter), member A1/2/3